MLWILFLVLMLLWLLGLATAFTMGGFIHLLVITAVAVLVIQVMEHYRLT